MSSTVGKVEVPQRLENMASYLTRATESDEGKVLEWDFDEDKNEWDVHLQITSEKHRNAYLDLSVLGPTETLSFWTDGQTVDASKRPVTTQILCMDLEEGGTATVYMQMVNTKIVC